MKVALNLVSLYVVTPEQSKRPGAGAVLRSEHGTLMYCSKMDDEETWYIDAMFPAEGPALHRYGWGERRVESLFPLKRSVADALERRLTSSS